MARQGIPLIQIQLSAGGSVNARRFVSSSATQTVADAAAIGVSTLSAEIGEVLPVVSVGTAIVEAGAAIPTVGTVVKSDANGRAIGWVTSGSKLGYALQIAGGAGDFIEVLLIPNA